MHFLCGFFSMHCHLSFRYFLWETILPFLANNQTTWFVVYPDVLGFAYFCRNQTMLIQKSHFRKSSYFMLFPHKARKIPWNTIEIPCFLGISWRIYWSPLVAEPRAVELGAIRQCTAVVAPGQRASGGDHPIWCKNPNQGKSFHVNNTLWFIHIHTLCHRCHSTQTIILSCTLW